MAAIQDEIPGLVIWATGQPEDQTTVSIQQQFAAFHRLNPWVLRALESLAAEYIARGAQHVAIGMLFEVLRWRHAQDVEGDEEFRLNNNFRSRYARMLIERHPEWSHVFVVRTLRTD